MDRIKERIDSLKISNEKKQTYKKLLLQVKTKQYPWQQDYMQPYANEKGQIVLREVENYKRNGDNFVEIINALNECGLFAGPNLKNQQADRGYLGGNIDNLPGGICLLGDYGLAALLEMNMPINFVLKVLKTELKFPHSGYLQAIPMKSLRLSEIKRLNHPVTSQ